ncbi:hypothetical protein AB1A65_02380 [Muricauda sp. ANG21]|uniref:hypothetical protein n=1 Tax=Allomuricauda sp. ANG21 TaxID=3042468 RepID=UPI00345337CD
MNRFFLFLILVVAQACAQKTHYGKLNHLGDFPSKLKEVSGMAIHSGDIWVAEDSGNKDRIYKIDKKGSITKSLKIDHAKNEDWEDLAMDIEGNLYIGDFGNNANLRKNLTIYRVSSAQLKKKEPNAEKIEFRYPEQKDFPPQKDSLLFDTEGFFHWKDHLYIFTKNRTRPYSGETLIYRVPDEEGEYDAEFLGSITLCKSQDHCSVTGADISADGKTIALLGYGFIFLVTNFELPNFDSASVQIIDFDSNTQTESIGFLDEKTLLIADERNKTTGGGKLYSYSID